MRAHAKSVSSDDGLEAIGPDKTPHEEDAALSAIRNAVIDAARNRCTITYDEEHFAPESDRRVNARGAE
jgi:hypothetical protein